jgi:hypothetical protein
MLLIVYQKLHFIEHYENMEGIISFGKLFMREKIIVIKR